MRATTIWATALAALSLAAAGCTGQFDIQQTEPIRVQIDGPPEETRVSELDAAPKEFVVENPNRADAVEVDVEVTQASDTPVTVTVTIMDSETNETIATRTIVVGGEGNETENETGNETGNETSPAPSPTNTTATNGTNTTATNGTNATSGTNETSPFPFESGGETVTETIVVNVRGKDNFVVLTQADEGEADVSIAARESFGGGEEPQETGNETQEP